jgi:hypothetical protein
MSLYIGRRRQRRGMVLIYVTVCMIALMAFVSLAVDIALCETAKTELQADADAAARAGITELLTVTNLNTQTPNTATNGPADTAIEDVMKYSRADGQYMTSTLFDSTTDIIWGHWTSPAGSSPGVFTAKGTPINAVEVIASRTTSTGHLPIGLFFASLLGRKTDGVQAVAIAAAVNLAPIGTEAGDLSLQTVGGRYNPYLAGEPTVNINVPPPSSGDSSYFGPPELQQNQYNPTGADIYQNSSGNAEHPIEYDMAGPTGGDIAGTASKAFPNGDPSESPLEVTTNNGSTIAIEGGDVVQVSVPDSYDGQENLVTNDNGGKPVTDANGFIDGNSPTPSEVYQVVGAISANDTNTFDQYAAYASEIDNRPGYTGNPTANSTTTNLPGAADDDIQGTGNNLTNIAAPLNSMLGVFLPPANGTTTQPPQLTQSQQPPGYDFSSQTSRDYTSLSPQVQQVFYAGSGATSEGSTQSIVVPSGAGRFYLGTMDGQEWANNAGQFEGINIGIWRVELVK